MSSFLGRTGSNIHNVLSYAKGLSCVLLLDEVDALAKRRDDEVEIGELKRLVTVLLQELDEWPERALLIGASNHPELLDRALWRRFDTIIRFDMPDVNQLARMIRMSFAESEPDQDTLRLLSVLMAHESFSEIRRDVERLRREVLLSGLPIQKALQRSFRNKVEMMSRKERHDVARRLLLIRRTQREIQELTGVSRDTLRKFARNNQTEAVEGD